MATATLTLEDISKLSDEVRHIVGAGLPLESNLVAAGQGHSARLQQITQAISEGLSSGRSLPDVIEHASAGAPRMLVAAVAAGVRTGNLATTIEMMGDFAEDLVNLRQQILRAISYPVTILVIAWGFCALILQQGLTRIYVATQQLDIQLHPVLDHLLWFNSSYPEWLLVLPLAGAIIVGQWLITGRGGAMAFRGPERSLLWLPGVGGLIRDLRFYTLTRMLSLLVERHVPLPEALLMAGGSCGSDALENACRRIAAQVENGLTDGIISSRRWSEGQLPPLLFACLRETGTDERRFVIRLSAVAEFYRSRLEFNVTWLRVVMPVVMFLLIGGGTVLLYSLAVFWPVVEVYRSLS